MVLGQTSSNSSSLVTRCPLRGAREQRADRTPWRSKGRVPRRAATGVPSARKRSRRTRRPDQEGLACASLRNLQEISRAFPRTSAGGALIILARRTSSWTPPTPEGAHTDVHERTAKMTIQANNRNNPVGRCRTHIARHLVILRRACLLLSLINLARLPQPRPKMTCERRSIASSMPRTPMTSKRWNPCCWGRRIFSGSRAEQPVWGAERGAQALRHAVRGNVAPRTRGSGLKVTMIGDGAAQVYVPIVFTIGAAGQQPQPTRFLMNMVLVTTPAGWRVSSILPIPASAQ